MSNVSVKECQTLASKLLMAIGDRSSTSLVIGALTLVYGGIFHHYAAEDIDVLPEALEAAKRLLDLEAERVRTFIEMKNDVLRDTEAAGNG